MYLQTKNTLRINLYCISKHALTRYFFYLRYKYIFFNLVSFFISDFFLFFLNLQSANKKKRCERLVYALLHVFIFGEKFPLIMFLVRLVTFLFSIVDRLRYNFLGVHILYSPGRNVFPVISRGHEGAHFRINK